MLPSQLLPIAANALTPLAGHLVEGVSEGLSFAQTLFQELHSNQGEEFGEHGQQDLTSLVKTRDQTLEQFLADFLQQLKSHGIDNSAPMIDRLRVKPDADTVRTTVGDFATTRVEETRAVGAALPFLQQAETVTALSVEEEDKPEAPGVDFAKYLAWHGVQINTLAIPLGSVTVGEAILGAAMRESADMLVMGAYGHNRFRELVFGGTTRYLLDEGGLPILMMH